MKKMTVVALVAMFPAAAAAETKAENFTKTFKDAGFQVETTAKYGSLNPIDWLAREPYVRLEARKMLQKEEVTTLWYVVYYANHPDDGTTMGLNYYWMSCNLRKMRRVGSRTYAEDLKETGGYTVLGQRLPETFDKPFSPAELSGLATALPIIDIGKMIKVTGDGEKKLSYWEHKTYSELMARFCKYEQ